MLEQRHLLFDFDLNDTFLTYINFNRNTNSSKSVLTRNNQEKLGVSTEEIATSLLFLLSKV